MSRRDEIISKAKAVPHMPMPIQRVMAYLNDPSASMTELAKLIEFDPNLTVNVLRLANSSYFCRGHLVTNVKDAVVRLGMKRVFQLVIASGVVPHVKSAVKGYGLSPGELLKHSIAVALTAECLGEMQNIPLPPHIFTAGLLINIGKTILGTYLEVDADPIIDLAMEKGWRFEEAEREILGIDHCELGALLLEHWQIPDDICLVVRYHVDPGAFPNHDLCLDLVHAGSVIVLMTGIGMGIDGMQYQLSDDVVERLNLTSDDVQFAMEDMLAHLDELHDLFICTV
ncbi:HDOD domain-containing protein [Desulfovibrio inopinatus]|uniref:HDOD domain-containing protein n=1 Tax=Desulfovibrio inopinatus TaxID=102109 RepID=UPI000487E2B0|nr:HDOD domain-containing protein [Desulfovibrio inopinatus]